MSWSTDGGENWASPVIVDSGICNLSSIAVYGNDVYVLISKGWPFMDYYFASSTDGGASFEPSYQINDTVVQDSVNEMPVGDLCQNGEIGVVSHFSVLLACQ
ncbi:MAG: sialidase family protein [bacterium]|nr:sialidase family protein [bacterium]